MWILPKNHSMYCLFAQGTEALRSDLNKYSDEFESSLMWRSKLSPVRTWSQRWSKVKWFRLLSGRMLRHSMRDVFEAALTSSQEDTRVNPSVLQENDLEKKTQGTSGHTSEELFQSAGQDGCFSKMLKDILAKGSYRSSPIWKKWVTKLRQEYSQRLKSAHHIREKECSSSGKGWATPDCSDRRSPNSKQQGLSNQVKNWATPNTMDILPPKTGEALERNKKKGGGKNLREDVVKHWPTATARDWKGCGNATDRKDGRSRMDTLEAVAKYGQQDPENHNTTGKSQGSWRTPAASDGEDGVKTLKSIQGDPQPKIKLRDHVNHTVSMTSKAKLNPDWVESLQGVPIYATMITTDINGVIMEAINEIGCEKCRKILFELWSTIGAKEVWPEIGRISEFSPAKVLQHEMHGGVQNNRSSDKRNNKKTCSKNTDEKPLRKMWYEKESTKASSRLLKARIDNDTLSGLSQECPSCRWIMGEIRTSGIEDLSCLRKDSNPRKRGREKGFLPDANMLTKMWMGVKASQRVDRLRLLGNGVVPRTAEKAFRTLHDRLIWRVPCKH